MDAEEYLSARVNHQLLTEMRTGRFRHEKKLPPEVELAEIFGVSRNVIRDVLGLLERTGIVTRKRGMGTLINRYVLDLAPRMDFALGFNALIEGSGYKAANLFVKRETIPASEEVAEKLEISAGDPVYRISRLDTADGEPAIYDIDYARVNYTELERSLWDVALLEESTYAFIKNTVFMNVADIEPIIVDDELAGICQIASGTPALYISSVHYSLKGRPVLYSCEYYLSGKVKQRILRKRM